LRRNSKQMKITTGSKVGVHYVLRCDNAEGELIEETRPEEPLVFTFGEDPMLPKFEKAVEGLQSGDKFTVFIPAIEAYGEEDESLYVEFPKSEFIAEGEVHDELFEIGEIIPMQTPEGQTLEATVSEVRLNTIVLDFNHPLAGEDLYFEGHIAKVG
jgi:FKBP-type peptidyl-prolyl cis-trans isomerase SlyD